MHNSTDRIEKEIVLRAPRSRVWRALADADEFGAWFGMKLEGTFAPGARAHGQIELPGHGKVTVEIAIERMVPESRMSYRWHPLPAARRAEALRMNDAGWAEELENIARYVAS